MQAASESIIRFQNLAMKCDYGSSMEEMIRDQLVMGIKREDIRRRLLANEKLILQKAIHVISIEEQLEKEVSYFQRLILQSENSKTSPRFSKQTV